MDAQRREAITEWSAREFTDGFAGLRRLADRGVSGAVTDGSGWLFLLDGRVVGTVDADLESFADADGTVYEAPDRSLPVLFAMRERGGRERAQYYTEDTPLADADQTLSDGGFTGYVELSEHVLSGDYYVVYAAGESMAAAFVGNARRLETGEDAFALADDEVGIYTVYEVDLDVRPIPRPAGATSDEPSATATNRDEPGVRNDDPVAGADDERTTDDVTSDSPSTDGVSTTDETMAGEVSADETTASETTPDSPTGTGAAEEPSHVVTDDSSGDADTGRSGAEGSALEAGSTASGSGRYDIPLDADWTTDPDAVADPRSVADAEEPDEPAEDDAPAEPVREDGTSPEPADPIESAADTDSSDTGEGGRSTSDGVAAHEGMDDVAGHDGSASEPAHPIEEHDVFSEEAAWRETASTPSLESSVTDGATETDVAEATGSPNVGDETAPPTDSDDLDGPADEPYEPVDGPGEVTDSSAGASVSGDDEPPATVESSPGGPNVGESEPDERLRELRSALASVTSERDDAIARRDAFRTRYEQIAAERDALVDERDELRATVDDLRSEVERLRTELATARDQLPGGDDALSPAAALEGTNLFVRYGSRTGATLEAAHDGERGRSELRENLQIEHHTAFETDGLTVDGEPYESFLHGTIAYRFTRWLTEDLLFEIAATGNGGALRELFDALPELDRAEIGGSVSVVHREDGEEVHEERAFDLVFRDRMGNPLFVAELNDSRSPTGRGSLESLVANGGALAASNDSFAGAFAVTASFFEPDALEVAGDAVGGGLFSRSNQKAFVKLSRKRGYHLCLVESRDGEFHLTLPDL